MYIYQSRFAESIQGMLDFKEQLGYAKSTHEPSLRSFDRYCAELYPETVMLSKELVLAWLEKRPNENSGGLKKRANTIRQFGKYLTYMENTAYVLPAGYIGGRSSFVPYILTDEELVSFFHAADSFPASRIVPCRHYVVSVFFRLVYCCGLRPNEGRLLRVDDVDLYNGRILVSGTKRNRDRIVMMSDDVAHLCARYDGIVRILSPKREYFFPNPTGGAYAPNTMEHIFLKCWQMSTTSKTYARRPCIYSLRHRFATAIIMNWMESGQDVQSILPHLSAYMGHASLSATAYYIHLLPSNLTLSKTVDWNRFSALIPEVRYEGC